MVSQASFVPLLYISTDDAVEKIMQLGQGCLLAKVDIEHAYRNIPVHPDDRSLLAMTWKGKIYVDTVLPFGLRSAPKIFSAVADALEWILLERGVSVCLHYLDDYLTVGKANSEECEHNLLLIKRVCEFLGVPLKLEKIEGPSSTLVFLGIMLDTTKQEISLPQQKLEELKCLIAVWKGRSSCTKRELLQLIGKLAHATKVVVAGRTFLRRMIDTAMTVKHLDHHIKLRSEFASDLAWWECFLPNCNLRSMMSVHGREWNPHIVFSTDVSGSWGCGAIWQTRWIQCPWLDVWESKSIALKELLPIVIACAVWGPSWAHQQVQVMCDNMSVVDIVRSKTSKDKDIMHLLRCLHFFAAVHDIALRAVHVPGILNTAADAISRNYMQVLRQVVPAAEWIPDGVSPDLWDLLVQRQPDWMSVDWRLLLKSCALRA